MDKTDLLIKVATALRLATKRKKQRTIVLDGRVIENTEPISKVINTRDLLLSVASISFGTAADGGALELADQNFTRTRVKGPFGIQREVFVLGFILESSTTEESYLIEALVSPNYGSIEVKFMEK